MSEICKTCPIADNDPNARFLNAAAARMADIESPWGFTVTYPEGAIAAEAILEFHTQGDAYDQGLKELGVSPKKVRQAQKCAKHILWGTCEFHRNS